MKKLITYSLFLLLCNVSFAQITFNVIKKDVTCNHTDLGRAEVFVTSTNAPYTYLWNTGQTTNSIEDVMEGNYSLLITDSLGNDTIVNIEIRLIVCVMVPDIIFTPNNDGINDVWGINNSQYFPLAHFMVFNRLGQRVFEYKGLYLQWDGKDLFGVPVPDASYYYIIYHDSADDGTIIKGCVSILK
jgi:gliding motility-associated-like protein